MKLTSSSWLLEAMVKPSRPMRKTKASPVSACARASNRLAAGTAPGLCSAPTNRGSSANKRGANRNEAMRRSSTSPCSRAASARRSVNAAFSACHSHSSAIPTATETNAASSECAWALIQPNQLCATRPGPSPGGKSSAKEHRQFRKKQYRH